MRLSAPSRRAYALPALALALGGLHAVAFGAEPLWWLQLACVGALAWLLGRAPGVVAGALIGWAFSLGWLVGGVWWLYISMHRYGGLPAWMAALAVLALCAFLSLYLAGAAAAWVALRQRQRPVAGALLFAALWLLAELARGVVFTGFPWVAGGYAHGDGPLAALAPWIGVYGIGALGAFAAALLVSGRLAAIALGALLLVVPLALPQQFTQASGRLSVALLQGNVPQNEKFEPTLQPEALEWTLTALRDSRAALTVAPETAVPLLPEQLPDGFWGSVREAIVGDGRAALVGAPLTRAHDDGGIGYTNSALGFSKPASGLPDGHYRYDKQHLVPFGEFIPLGFRWFTEMMNIPLGDFDRGPHVAPSFPVLRADGGTERVGPNICYEDLFGEELAARFGPQGDAPTILANLSNIAWFGESVAVDQHLQISRLRSLELQRPMLRATNTGATAVIDHRGVVTHALAPHTRGVLQGEVEGREGVTPFAWWAARAGLWPLLVAALAVVALAARARRRGADTG